MPPALQGLLSLLARLCLCTIFIMSAVGNKIPKFNDVAGYMASAGVPQPQVMLVGAIVFLLLGSALVVTGYQTRYGATLLLVFLILATYFFHNFWAKTDPQEQQVQMIQFMKNLSMMGAMLFLIANGGGAWSVDACRGQKAPAA